MINTCYYTFAKSIHYATQKVNANVTCPFKCISIGSVIVTNGPVIQDLKNNDYCVDAEALFGNSVISDQLPSKPKKS